MKVEALKKLVQKNYNNFTCLIGTYMGFRDCHHTGGVPCGIPKGDMVHWTLPKYLDDLNESRKLFDSLDERDKRVFVSSLLYVCDNDEIRYVNATAMERGYAFILLKAINDDEIADIMYSTLRNAIEVEDDKKLCPKCHENPALPPHICPRKDIVDDETLCTCCNECRDECALEV